VQEVASAEQRRDGAARVHKDPVFEADEAGVKIS